MPRRPQPIKSELLEKAMSPAILDAAWGDLARERTPWSPKTDRERLKLNFPRHLLECREDVLSGAYRPHPLRQTVIPQAGGRKRVITLQYLRDKLVQRALWLALRPHAESRFHPCSFAYRRGMSANMARRFVQTMAQRGYRCLFYARIERFFDNVPQKRLQRLLNAVTEDKAVSKLTKLWLAQHHDHEDRRTGARYGVAEGTVLSPFYCNLYLNQLDKALTKNRVTFARFADRLVLMAEDEKTSERGIRSLSRQLAKLELSLHYRSGRVLPGSTGMTFAGEESARLLETRNANFDRTIPCL